METLNLSNLTFADLYVCLDNGEACYQAFDLASRRMRLFDLPVEYKADLAALVETFKTTDHVGRAYNFNHGNLRLRSTKIAGSNGPSWVMFQPIAKPPRQIDAIGFAPAIINQLQKMGQNHGLILVSGGVGQGKSTTASALLYDYLHRYGGVACTLDSNEYLLAGRQGPSGLCYQFEVQKKQDWESVLGDCLQLHARYLLVGELHTSEMACEILRSATSGQLVIASIQAGSLEEAIEALHYLAERSMGNYASGLLATALTAVIYQQLGSVGFEARVLTVEHGSAGDACRTLIRERRNGQISTIVNQQMARLR